MKYLFVLLLSLSPLALGQVPVWPDELEANYVVYNDGLVLYVPDTHEVVIQPKGWNTAPFTWENMLGVSGNKWPLLAYFCKPQFSTGGPVPDEPEACNFPNVVVRK